MKLPFDKIYCLHLADDSERYNQCISEFKRIGILDQVEFWWTCKRDISNTIGELIPALTYQPYWEDLLNSGKISRTELGANLFNCAFEHYTIAKTSYQRGFEHILIIEDDIKFIDNLKLIEDTFTNLPEDYDIIKFHDNESYYSNWYSNEPSDKQLFRRYDQFHTSTMCYALSKRGMEAYFTELDRDFVTSDKIDLSKFSQDLNIYGLTYKIVIDRILRSRIWQSDNINHKTYVDIKKMIKEKCQM